MARDSYSYLHLPDGRCIVLLALGVKKALEHVDEPLSVVVAAALCGGVALYLLVHVAFRLRNVGTLNRQRLVTIAVLIRAHAARGERHRPLGAARGGPGVHRADRLRGDPLPGGAGTRTRAG